MTRWNKAKKAVLGLAGLSAMALGGLTSQAQAQSTQQAQQDCEACEERVEQLHIQRGSHAVQDYNAFHVDGDTTQYKFTIPKGDADWARTHNGKELQHLVLLNNQGEWQAPQNGQVYLQATQPGDKLKGLPEGTFNGQPAYVLDVNKDKKLTLREVLAYNNCEASTGILVTNPQRVAVEKEILYVDRPTLHPGDVNLTVKQYSTPEKDEPTREAPKKETPDKDSRTEVFASYLVGLGSDNVNQRTTNEFPSTATRTGSTYTFGVKHISPETRARIQALIGDEMQSVDSGVDIHHRSNDVQGDIHRTISDGPFTLGVYGRSLDLTLSQGNKKTSRHEYNLGGMLGVQTPSIHLAAGASKLVQNNGMTNPHVSLEQNFDGYQLDAILDVTQELSKRFDFDARLQATQQNLKGDIPNVGPFEQTLRKFGADVRLSYQVTPSVSLFGQAKGSIVNPFAQTDLYDQNASHKDVDVGGGVRVNF